MPLKRLRKLLPQMARAVSGPVVGKAGLSLVSTVARTPSPLARRLLDELQPDQPISLGKPLPEVDIVIPVSKKDFGLVPATVTFARRNTLNPIKSVTLVVPKAEINQARALNVTSTVVCEETLLPRPLIKAVRQNHPKGRYGWILQQVIGLFFVRSSESEGVLVLDSDTLLTKPRALLDRDRRQLLSLSHEYVQRYESHAAHIWGDRQRHFGLSYVTHHQLMQPWVLREMFPKVDDLMSWVSAAPVDHRSPIADYHCYGRWFCDNHPALVGLARWGNKSVPRNTFSSLEPQFLEDSIRGRFPNYFSVSLHSYLA